MSSDPIDRAVEFLERARQERITVQGERDRLRNENHVLKRKMQEAESRLRDLAEQNLALEVALEDARSNVASSKRAIASHASRTTG